MIPVTQTLLTKDEGGNCFASCLASIFELPLEDVPNAALIWRLDDEDAGERGHQLVDEWLARFGLAKADLDVADCHGWRPDGYWIGSYDSPRLIGETHAVVCHGYDGVVWDPHPSAVAEPVDPETLRYVYWLYVLDPARFIAARAHAGEIVNIARCPEHGLHGARTECFVCGGPVEQVPMLPLSRSPEAVTSEAVFPTESAET